MDLYNTKEDVLKLGIIDPEMEEILKDHPAPVMDMSMPIEQLRGIVSAMEKSGYETCPSFDTQESVVDIPMRDGHLSQLRIVKPGNTSSKNPVVVLIFGGAFIMGSNIQSTAWARMLANLYSATVVQPSYRLAPEHTFPAAPNDVWDSVKWVAANESALDADLTKGFLLGGASAGGNLSIVTAHRAVKEKLSPPITGALISIPVCMSKVTVPEKYKDLWVSREQNANAPCSPCQDKNNVGGFEFFYKPDLLSEDYSPFNSTAPFSDLPPMYVQVAGLDVLRDDGIIYAKVLADHGVDVKLDAYPGVPHGHFNLWPRFKQSIKSQEDTIQHFGWLLGHEIPMEKVKEAVAMTFK